MEIHTQGIRARPNLEKPFRSSRPAAELQEFQNLFRVSQAGFGVSQTIRVPSRILLQGPHFLCLPLLLHVSSRYKPRSEKAQPHIPQQAGTCGTLNPTLNNNQPETLHLFGQEQLLSLIPICPKLPKPNSPKP